MKAPTFEYIVGFYLFIVVWGIILAVVLGAGLLLAWGILTLWD